MSFVEFMVVYLLKAERGHNESTSRSLMSRCALCAVAAQKAARSSSTVWRRRRNRTGLRGSRAVQLPDNASACGVGWEMAARGGDMGFIGRRLDEIL